MVKNKHLFCLLAFACLLSQQVFATAASSTWPLTGNSGTPTVSGNVTATTPTAGAGTASFTFGTNFMYGSSYNSGSLDLTAYYEYTMSPTAGNTLTITTLSVDMSVSSSTMSAAFYYSTDGFATSAQAGGNFSVSSSTLTTSSAGGLSIVVPSGSTLTVRVYGWAAGSSGTTFRNANTVFSGSTAVSGATSTLSSSNPAVAAGNVSQNSTHNVIYNFSTAITGANITINTVNFTTATGTYVAADLTQFQLWYSTTNTFASAAQIGSNITTTLGNGAHSFTGLTQVINAATTGYFFITADVTAAATVGHTVIVSAITSANLTFASGTSAGSAFAGGAQTVTAAACVATLPYTENFESAWTTPTTLVTPTCAWSSAGAGNDQWHQESYTTGWSSGSGNTYPSNGANGTSHSARFHTYDAASGTTGDLITPLLDCSAAGAKTMTFWYVNTGGTDQVDVYLSTDGGATWSASLKTLTTVAAWTQYSVTLTNATTSQCKIKFTGTSNFGASDQCIDEINITGGACTPPAMAPTTFASSNVNGSTMTIGWNLNGGTNVLILASSGASVPNTNPTSGTTYTANAAFGSGSSIGNAYVVYDGTGTSLNMTGLSLGTQYNYAIYEYTPGTMCYRTATFLSGNATTTAGCTSPLPYSETFEASWTVANTLPPCTWSSVGAGSDQWHREDYSTGWTFGNAGGYTPLGALSTSHSARFNSYGASNNSTGDLITPNIDFTPAGTKTMTFWYNNPDGSDVLNVYLSTNGGGAYGASLLQVTTTSGWTMYTVNLGASTSTTCKVKFTATSDYGNTDLGIDEVNISVPGCTPPTIQPSGIVFTSTSNVATTVSWTNGDGTNQIVLVQDGGAVSSNPVAGTAYTANTVYGSGTQIGAGNFVVYNGTGTSVTVTGLVAGHTYYFAVYEFNSTGNCYLTTLPLTGNVTTSSTVVSNASDVIAIAASEAASISSLTNTAGPLAIGGGTQVWQFTVRDGGGAADADALPTIVTGLTLSDNGSANQVVDWAASIKSVDLFELTTNTHLAQGVVTTGPNQIVFSGFSYTVPDGSTKNLSVRLSLNCGIGTTGSLSGQEFGLSITNANITVASSATSSQTAPFATINTAAGKNLISVVQTKLAFTIQPVTTSVNTAMAPAVTVAAVDACGNVATGFSGNISLTSTGTLTGTPVSVAAVNGVATFTTLTHTVSGVGLTLNATSGALTTTTSTAFDIIGGGPTYLVDEQFTNTTTDANIPTTTTGFTATAGWISYTSGSFNYGRNPNALKFTGSGTLTSPAFATAPDLLSFWAKAPAANTSSIQVQALEAGVWTTLGASLIDATPNPVVGIPTSPRHYFFTLTANTTQVRFVFTFGGTIYFDDVMVRAAGACSSNPLIESILVNSCEDQEGVNEMMSFSTGNTAVNVSDLIVTVPSVQNGGVSFCTGCAEGFVANAAYIAQINTNSGSTVVYAPPGGVIPAASEVLVFMGANPSYTGFAFGPAGSTFYALFCNNVDGLGRFSNSPGANRYLTIQDHATGCFDEVYYDSHIPISDGELAMFDMSTRALSYVNSGCAGIMPLPVEMLTFTGARMDKSVRLEWSTASETNNDYFTISRARSNGESFVEVGKIKGAGNSSTTRFYMLDDDQAPDAACYYQIVQTDMNGQVHGLRTIMVGPLDQFEVESVFPNPANNQLNVAISQEGDSYIQISIVDLVGKTVFKTEKQMTGRKNTLSLDIAELPAGMYMLMVNGKIKSFQSKFVKQ